MDILTLNSLSYSMNHELYSVIVNYKDALSEICHFLTTSNVLLCGRIYVIHRIVGFTFISHKGQFTNDLLIPLNQLPTSIRSKYRIYVLQIIELLCQIHS